MTYVPRTCIVDWRSGGLGVQDVTDLVDRPRTTLRTNARGAAEQGVLALSIPPGHAGVTIDSLMDVWDGFFDVGLDQWDPTRFPYGGVIVDHDGGSNAAEHTLDLRCAGYEHAAQHVAILAWPVLDPNGIQLGYPPGHSVKKIIVGTTGGGASYNGLLPAHMANVSLTGIEAVFDTLICDAGHLPGIPMAETSNVLGSFGFVYLSDALVEMNKVAAAIDDSVRPFGFWRGVAIGSSVVPQYCLVDLNAVSGGIVCVVNNAPTTGQIRVTQPFKHSRDARKATPAVIVKGVGADLAVMGTPLVYFKQVITAHANAYPNHYSVTGTFDLLVVQTNIATLAEAQSYAERLETQVWAPRGSIEFDLFEADLADVGKRLEDVQVGTRIHYIDDMETLDAVYPVIAVEVDPAPGVRKAHVVIGFTPLDFEDVMVGGTADMPWLRDGTNPFGGTGRGAAYGVPQPQPIVGVAPTSQTNVLKGQTDTVVGLVLKPGLTPPGGTPATLPANQVEHHDANGNVRDFARNDGVDGLIRLPFHFTAAGTVDWLVDDPGTIQRIIQSNNTATITLNLDTVLQTTPSTYLKQTPPTAPTLIASGTPLAIQEGHLLTVTTTAACTFTLSGRGPLV